MKIKIRLVTIIITLILIGSCALTPTSGIDNRDKSQEMGKVEMPKVDTEYKPRLNRYAQKKEKPIMAEQYTLEQVQVSKKKNGILLRFKYKGEDPKENISTFFSGDKYFNITFFKGEFGADIRKSLYNGSIIKKLQFFEFEESVQVTVRLKDDHKSTFVQTDDEYITISVFS